MIIINWTENLLIMLANLKIEAPYFHLVRLFRLFPPLKEVSAVSLGIFDLGITHFKEIFDNKTHKTLYLFRIFLYYQIYFFQILCFSPNFLNIKAYVSVFLLLSIMISYSLISSDTLWMIIWYFKEAFVWFLAEFIIWKCLLYLLINSMNLWIFEMSFHHYYCIFL